MKCLSGFQKLRKVEGLFKTLIEILQTNRSFSKKRAKTHLSGITSDFNLDQCVLNYLVYRVEKSSYNNSPAQQQLQSLLALPKGNPILCVAATVQVGALFLCKTTHMHKA